MSFNLYLDTPACTHCGHREERVYRFNLTHNVNEIVDRCLIAGGAPTAKELDSYYRKWSWGRLVGWKASEIVPILERALAVATGPERETEFRELEPQNKLGDLDTVRRVMSEFLSACREHPDATVSVWG